MEAEQKVFCLSNRLWVEITAGGSGLVVEWRPAMPDELTAKELRKYRAARMEMAGRLAAVVGGSVVVVET